ncbi:MAG: peptidylprolyl isomerase, partial [Odoribacter sp.]|nr:peptidylprolyl isomerase [Odoribacter sp.]
PFWAGDYRVFGEVVEGRDVLDKIASVKTNRNDRPVDNVVIVGMKLKRK